MTIRCEIASQDRLVFEGDADIVVLPGTAGEMGILPHHTPLLTTLKMGVIKVRLGGKEEIFTVTGGLAEVQPQIVTVLADAAENIDEIDIARAEAARERIIPVHPFMTFNGMAEEDLRALVAYLRTLPPNARPSQAHDLGFPYGFRFSLAGWKWLYFTPGPFVPDPKASATINRGAYLAEALGHCSECHTPRNALGGPKRDRFLAGGKGPEGKGVPNLTPTKLKKWDDGELKDFLQTGLTPDGDVAAEDHLADRQIQ